MTDRSSEERSRFEKWTTKQIKAISPLWELERDGIYFGYVVRDPTEMVAILNRAALEDRQEAAPLSNEDLEGSSKVRMCLKCGATKGMRRCPECGDYADPCVPSEATPSKENAPMPTSLKDKLYSFDMVAPNLGYVSPGDFSAPAPEVQGTPKDSARLVSTTSRAGQNDACLEPVLSVRADTVGSASFEEMATDEAYQRKAIAMVEGTPQFNLEESLAALQKLQDKFAAEHPDIVAAASARGADGGSGMAAQNSPVGTPQKETPPAKYCTCEQGWFSAHPCPFHLSDTQKPTPVPEGVQGKELQTPEIDEAADLLGKLELAISVKEELLLLQNFRALAKAAGRRSAITEIEKWAEDCDRITADATELILAKCAELQEKTK